MLVDHPRATLGSRLGGIDFALVDGWRTYGDFCRGESVTAEPLLFSLRLAVFIACTWGFWSAIAPLPITRGDLTAKGCERVRLSLKVGGFHVEVEEEYEGEPGIALAMRRAATTCCS
jgi:hypothetical protein